MKHEKNGYKCTDPYCWCKNIKHEQDSYIYSGAKDWREIADRYVRKKEWNDYTPKEKGYWYPPETDYGHIQSDMVNEPEHYKLMNGEIEAIDLIKDVLTREEFLGYLRGTLLAYHLRANRKNGEEDLRKADIYNNWLIKELDNEDS